GCEAARLHEKLLTHIRWGNCCWLSLIVLGPMREKIDANDGEPWTEMDVEDLIEALTSGDTIEDAAEFLCRSGTVDEVRRKADELGLIYKSRRLSYPWHI